MGKEQGKSELLPASGPEVTGDWLGALVLHTDRIDWTNSPRPTPDSVTRQFIGPFHYWSLPQFQGMSAAEIEISILSGTDVLKWKGSSPWKPFYQHFLTLTKILCPSKDITPSLADVVMLFCAGIGRGRKITNMIGSQNSGKSSLTALLVMTCMAINPTINFALIANPFKTTSESTIWGDFKEVYEEITQNHPDLWPESRLHADKRIVLVKVPKAGYVEIRPVDDVGKLLGTKTKKIRRDDGTYITPLMLMVLDEVNRVKSPAFLEGLSNITSQEGFYAHTSQNFKDPADMGGRLAEPRSFHGSPDSYDQLTHDMRVWYSFSSSITIRFNGLLSPNLLAHCEPGEEIYPYLFKIVNLEHIIETYGKQSPEYYSQVLSFPVDTMEVTSVISSSTIRRSRIEDPHYTMIKRLGKVAFGDPAFGGSDLCLWGSFLVALCKVADPGGHYTDQTLFISESQMRRMKLNRDLLVDSAFLMRLSALSVRHRIDLAHFIEGKPVSYEDQIAVQYAEHCIANSIPYNCFGYDSSMRHEIMNSVFRIMGSEPVSFGYNEPPKGFFLRGLKKNSEDCCGDRISELAFMAADLIDNKQVRGESLSPALIQLSRTQFKERGGKRFVEKKKEYKDRWSGVSPDARDVFLGGVGMAARTGMVLNNPLTGKSSAAKGSGRKPLLPLRRPARL